MINKFLQSVYEPEPEEWLVMFTQLASVLFGALRWGLGEGDEKQEPWFEMDMGDRGVDSISGTES